MTNKVYQTKDGILKLEFVGWEEPNNGRELLIPKITKNGIDITAEICKNWGGWNRIPMSIEFEFSNSKIPVVFIPFEKNFILYDYEENRISLVNLSTKLDNNRFLKNKFYDEKIIFVSSRMIKIKNLLNNEYYKLEAKENEFFRDAEINQENELKIKLNLVKIKENQMKNIAEKLLTINLKNVV